jgi:hypothetical protein
MKPLAIRIAPREPMERSARRAAMDELRRVGHGTPASVVNSSGTAGRLR